MKTKIYGHRGASGNYPENTMLSFQKALEQGADGLELDVHPTKDGEIVVIHDETLERTTNGKGFVKDTTLAELKKLDAGLGQEIPTLTEVLQLLSGTDTEINIELKTYLLNYSGIENQVLSTVKQHGQGTKVVYSSFHLPTLLRLKKLDSSTNIAWLLGGQFPLPHPDDYINELGLEALHLGKDMLLARPEHYSDIFEKIRVWTVNDEAEIKKFLELGVGAIVTDFTERAVSCYDIQ